MASMLYGYLVGANKKNRIDFYTPDKQHLIRTEYTSTSGQYTAMLDTGQYRIKVNEKCWATSPDPLNKYPSPQYMNISAPCVNQGNYDGGGGEDSTPPERKLYQPHELETAGVKHPKLQRAEAEFPEKYRGRTYHICGLVLEADEDPGVPDLKPVPPPCPENEPKQEEGA